MLEGRSRSGLETQQRVTAARMGMIGFDIVCEPARSGPRMRSYLVNALRKNTSADNNSTVSAKKADFALAA
jgi:hypothetical protein